MTSAPFFSAQFPHCRVHADGQNGIHPVQRNEFIPAIPLPVPAAALRSDRIVGRLSSCKFRQAIRPLPRLFFRHCPFAVLQPDGNRIYHPVFVAAGIDRILLPKERYGINSSDVKDDSLGGFAYVGESGNLNFNASDNAKITIFTKSNSNKHAL